MKEGWEEVQIKDFGRVVTGKTPPTGERKYFDGEYNFVSPKDMEFDSRYIRTTQTAITPEAIAKFRNQVLPRNAVMFTAISYGFGKIGLAESTCLTNQQINSIIVDPARFDYNFVYYLLRYSKDRLLSYNSGIVTPIIPKSAFEKVKMVVPKSKTEQARIGSILSAYDDLIENNLQRIKLLEELAQRTYEEWFVHFRVKREFSEANGEALEMDAGTGLPVGWESRRLVDVASLVKKTVLPSSISPETPYIGLEHIPRKSIALSDWETAAKVDSLKIEFRKGDILFGKIRPYFHKVGVALIDGIASSDAIVLRAKKGEHQGIVLQTVFSDVFVNTATQSSNGTKMPRANWDVLKEYPVVIPSPDVIAKYNGMSKSIIESIGNLCAQNRLLQESRDLLLPRLMSGELEV